MEIWVNSCCKSEIPWLLLWWTSNRGAVNSFHCQTGSSLCGLLLVVVRNLSGIWFVWRRKYGCEGNLKVAVDKCVSLSLPRSGWWVQWFRGHTCKVDDTGATGSCFLLSIPSKLFTKIFPSHALPAIRSRHYPQQAKFRLNLSTSNHIFVHLIHEISQDSCKHRLLYIPFVDLKAASDMVNHASFWEVLSFISSLSNTIPPPPPPPPFQWFYCSAEGCVCIDRKDSGWFPIYNRVRQGCMANSQLLLLCHQSSNDQGSVSL